MPDPQSRRPVSVVAAMLRPAIAVPPSSEPSPSGESTSSRRSVLPAETERHPPDPPFSRTFGIVRRSRSPASPVTASHGDRPPLPAIPHSTDRHTRNSTPRFPSRHPRLTRHTPDMPDIPAPPPNRTPPRTPRRRPGTKKAAPEGTASFIGSRIAGINNPAIWKRRRRSSAHWRGGAPASRR